MKLKEYFKNHQGIGVLSSANEEGKVASAIYAKPHVREEDTIAFIMRERRTYANLLTNDSASYLFIDHQAPYSGIRLNLEKIKEDDDQELIQKMTRRNLTKEKDEARGPKHIVYFRVKDTLPLIGA